MANGHGNLPQALGSFFGRRVEIETAVDLLRRVPLLTLTGPGGVGKTELALRVAARCQASMPDGVRVIDLTAQPADASVEQLFGEIAMVLGLKPQGDARTVLLDYLRQNLDAPDQPAKLPRLLLVLDNCEHLVSRRPEQQPSTLGECVTALLGAASLVRVLATSRQPLGVDFERALTVPPLPDPDAVALFRSGAAAVDVKPAAVTDTETITTLCSRLDGLPLAIGLAASRLRTLTVYQLMSELEVHGVRLLTGPRGNRHGTMQASMDLSYRLCSEAEQLLWTRIAAFPHSFDLQAARAVCAGHGIDPDSVLDLLTGLVDRSVLVAIQPDERETDDANAAGLINQSANTRQVVRYRMLITLREYGVSKLDAAGDAERVRDAHRAYYSNLLAGFAASWLGPDELHALTVIRVELPHILAAIRHAVARGELANARAICRDLVRSRAPYFWGFLGTASDELDRVIGATDATALIGPEEVADLTSTMATAAWVAATRGLDDDTQRLLAECHRLLDQWQMPTPPPVDFAEGAALVLGQGDTRGIPLLEKAYAALASVPETVGDAHMALLMLGIGGGLTGDSTASEAMLAQANDAQAPWAISWAYWDVAFAAWHAGRYQDADDYLTRALELQRDMDDQWGLPWTFEVMFWNMASQLDRADDPRAAAKLAAWVAGAADALERRVGSKQSGMLSLARGHDIAMGLLAAVLEQSVIDAEMKAGSRGYARALRVVLGETATRRVATGPSSLTDRELEIVPLVIQGLMDAEIAAQLRISVRTVQTHVRNIRRKLGANNRRKIAAALPREFHQPI